MSRGDADPSQSDAAPSTTDGSLRALSAVPALTMLCAGAAVLHALVYQLILPLLVAHKAALPTLLLWCAPFSLNLAAASGLVALTACVVELVKAKALADASRRLLIAFLCCIVLSTLTLATFLPAGRVTPQQVLVAAGALHTLNTQLAITTVRSVYSLAGRTSVLLIAASSLFPLFSLLLRHLPSAQGMQTAGSATLHGLGEFAFLLTPLAAAFVVIPWDDSRSSRSARRVGTIAVALMALAFAAASRMPQQLYGHLLYTTLRLEWTLHRASLGYAVPVSLAIGAAMASLASRDERHQQGGAGLWLWLAGGYNPLTPARIMMTALAAMLLCRACLSLGWDRSESTSVKPS